MTVEINDVGLFKGTLQKVVGKTDRRISLAPVWMAPTGSMPRYQREGGIRAIPYSHARVEREMIVYESDGPAAA